MRRPASPRPLVYGALKRAPRRQPRCSMQRKTLVIGGTLFIGRELVRRLLERGDRVTILHRGRSRLPEGVDEIICDRNDETAVRQQLAGREFDVVFDNAYDWERGTTAPQVRAAAEACATGLE